MPQPIRPVSAFTQAQINQLTNAIATGVREITHNGERQVFNSIDDMLSLRDRMIRELENQGDGIPRPAAHRSVFLSR